MIPREVYDALLSSGMFWEWYPNLTGRWELDKYEWENGRQP